VVRTTIFIIAGKQIISMREGGRASADQAQEEEHVCAIVRMITHLAKKMNGLTRKSAKNCTACNKGRMSGKTTV